MNFYKHQTTNCSYERLPGDLEPRPREPPRLDGLREDWAVETRGDTAGTMELGGSNVRGVVLAMAGTLLELEVAVEVVAAAAVELELLPDGGTDDGAGAGSRVGVEVAAGARAAACAPGTERAATFASSTAGRGGADDADICVRGAAAALGPAPGPLLMDGCITIVDVGAFECCAT